MPFGQNIIWQNSKPHTLVELNANYLYRNLTLPNYQGSDLDITLERLRYGGSFGYTWDHNRNVKHKLLPFNLSYSHLISGRRYYDYLTSLTSDIQFKYQSIDYVLLNTHYEYTYSNQLIGTRNNFNYLRFSIETAASYTAPRTSSATTMCNTTNTSASTANSNATYIGAKRTPWCYAP